jgi:hypothetical protein
MMEDNNPLGQNLSELPQRITCGAMIDWALVDRYPAHQGNELAETTK